MLALTRGQREGAEGAACTQRGQTLRSGQRGSGKDARRRGHLNQGQQQPPQWWQLGSLTGHLRGICWFGETVSSWNGRKIRGRTGLEGQGTRLVSV